MRHTMLREKRRRVRSEQHCDGRVTAGKNRERRDDCCALPVIDGPTRSRIQQVAVPATIELEIALVIAARCDGTVAKLDGSDHCRSEEHTSELQSQFHLVCRLLLEKKK